MSPVDYISQSFYSECFHLRDFEDLITLLIAYALHQKSIVMSQANTIRKQFDGETFPSTFSLKFLKLFSLKATGCH